MRTIVENAEKAKGEKIKNYQPSPEYLKLRNLLLELISVNNQTRELNEKFRTLSKDINILTNANYFDCVLRQTDDESKIVSFLSDLLLTEIQTPKLPTIEELKEDITISAIDEDFDAAKVIESLIGKYK